MVSDFYEAISDVSFRCLVLSKSRLSISPSDGIGKSRVDASHIHRVKFTLYRNFEYHTIFGLDAIGLLGNGIAIGFYRQQNAIVLYSFDSDGFGGA